MKNNYSKNILQLIEKSPVAVSLETMRDKLKIQSKQDLKKSIEELTKSGKIVKVKNGKFVSTKAYGRIPAKIVSLCESFAFAEPLDDDKTDIFIHAKNLKDAIPGDTVLLYKIRNSPKGLSGIVERILKKSNGFVTGTLKRNNENIEIIPDNGFRFNIPVLKGYTMGAKSSDKVLALIVASPKRHKLGAKILKIYGSSNIARICADSIIDSSGIPNMFPDSVKKEAESISKLKITNEDISQRLDLRNEIIFTIDGADSKDLDDAISVKRCEFGWKLGVHIADVSHYVSSNTSLDKQAFKRGTSVYFADRVIPMYPKELSNGICSLNPNEDKLTFSAIINLDNEAKILSYEFKKSIIRSRVKGIYSEVNKIIDKTSDDSINLKYKDVIPTIKEALKLSELIDKNAKQRGTMDLDSGESKFYLNKDGICIDVKPREQGISEKIIENLMITANQAAALYAKSLNIPFIYRIHEPPAPEKIRTLATLANALGLKSHRVRQGLSPTDLSELLEQAKNQPGYKIVSHQVLRTMSKARYSNKPIGHFGLSLEDYCHFTSPIRRYPDTCIHRILSDAVNGKDINKISKKYSDFVEEASRQSTLCEIRAMKAERDAEKCYMAEFMTQHIGEIFDGTISGVNSKGIFVELPNSVEGFLDLNYYTKCKFSFNGITAHKDMISGKTLSIGDKISIKVVSANVASGEITFKPECDTL